MVEDRRGDLYLVGRYRNLGDSRTGLQAGTRGLELAVFKIKRQDMSVEKILSFSKADLSAGDARVLSIEGAALHFDEQSVRLYVSSEKANVDYPPDVRDFQKPGTGVWTIDLIEAATLSELSPENQKPFLQSRDPRYLHVKDPFLYQTARGDTMVLFCTHPYSWTSHNTGYVIKRSGSEQFGPPVYDFFPRGTTWDVAMTRGTSIVRLPSAGVLADAPPVSLFFYDGGECLRRLDEHGQALKRPRGYSCEEIGGLACFTADAFTRIVRLTPLFPLFTSPWGTGSSRYVDILPASEGFYATWQQSQRDGSQPLVMNFVSREEIEELLAR